MTRYVCLIRFTEEGAKAIKKSTVRAGTFNRLAAKGGVKVEGQYWTMGGYDGVLILAADDEGKVLRCLADLAIAGSVRTEALRAFTDTEFDAIVGK